jgi:hypothetical protein
VLTSTIVPLGELAAVELHVRLPRGLKPSELQPRMVENVSVPLRSKPEIDVEQMDLHGVVGRIAVRPESKTDGQRLADEVVAAIDGLIGEESSRDGRPSAEGPLDRLAVIDGGSDRDADRSAI